MAKCLTGFLTMACVFIGINCAGAEINNRDEIIKGQSNNNAWNAVLERHTDFKKLSEYDNKPYRDTFSSDEYPFKKAKSDPNTVYTEFTRLKEDADRFPTAIYSGLPRNRNNYSSIAVVSGISEREEMADIKREVYLEAMLNMSRQAAKMGANAVVDVDCGPEKSGYKPYCECRGLAVKFKRLPE